MKQEWVQLIENLKKPSLYFDIKPTTDTSPNLCNHVGGKPYLKKNEKYPVCQYCREKQEFVFQLYIPNHSGAEYELYVFYYCFSCQNHQGEHGFCLRKYLNPKLSECKEPRMVEYLPYGEILFEPIWSLPDWNTLQINHPSLFQALQTNKNEDPWDVYDELRSNILGVDGYECFNFYKGHPQFMKEARFPLCSCCQKPMKLWVQLDSNEELDLYWSNSYGSLYVFKCPEEKDEYKILVQSENKNYG